MGHGRQSGLWRAPHLSLFLLAAAWATTVPLAWFLPGMTCDPAHWHIQELVAGFAGAAMGGYLLTALPHWLTKSDRASARTPSWAVPALVLAWISGRLGGGPCLSDGLAFVAVSLYPLGLSVCLAVPLALARLWSRLPIALSPLLLALIVGQLRLHDDTLTAVLGMALLVALVGGRIIPAFLAARDLSQAMVSRRPVTPDGRLADLALALALALHVADAGGHLVGTSLIVASIGQMARMLRWRLHPAIYGRQCDSLALVAAWIWLPAGLWLLGVVLLGATDLQVAQAVHALTMGLMGSMILAVLGRAYMRRAPGVLRLGIPLGLAVLLVHTATVLRLVPFGLPHLPALAWIAAWAIVTAVATLGTLRPIPHPVLSARRADRARCGPLWLQETTRSSRSHLPERD